MKHLPTILLVLSLPAGFIGFIVGARVVAALLPGQTTTIIGLFLPLLVGGLFMLPFLIPFVDRKAKADLAEHRAQMALEEQGDTNAEQAPKS